MRDSRRQDSLSTWAASAALLVLAFAAMSPVRAGATPTPTAGPVATSTATPTPTSTPMSSCQLPMASAYPHDHVVRGTTVHVAVSGFEPTATVTLLLVALDNIQTTPIGTAVTDTQGNGSVAGVIPSSRLIGEAQLHVVSEHCIAYTEVVVTGSAETMTADPDGVRPGDSVTITAGGFLPNSAVLLTIDHYPIQGECYPHRCHELGLGTTDAVGRVVMHTRIPTDASPGAHHLYATGYLPDDFGSDLTVGVAIDVAGATGTVPPTDTAT